MASLPSTIRPRVPPLPQFVVLVDREDGTEWVLSHTVQSGKTYVTLNTEALQRGSLAPYSSVHRYEAFEGPLLGRRVRLFVRGGRLGYEMTEQEGNNAPPYTRKGVSRKAHRIVVPEGWVAFPDELGWEEESPIP